METLILIFVFIFGTIIGSFLNVVICRHNTGRGLGGRSKCAVTGKTLEWFELIPILSFLFQGGRSRYSKSKISWQYPLVEFFTGFTFLLVFHKFIPNIFACPEIVIVQVLFYFAIFSILILIFVYDWYHQIIPDEFLLPLGALAFSGALVLPHYASLAHLLLSGILLPLPVLFLWLITRGKGMGFADILLLIPIGWILGTSRGFASLLLAFWIGAIAGILIMMFGNKRLTSKIPFAPFIIIGFAIAFLYNVDMHSIANFFARLI